MRGLVFTGGRRAELRSFPDPDPRPGEAVVAIRASGLCGTDLHRYRAEVDAGPLIVGHEPCGVVAALGEGAPPGIAVGDRVMVHHYAGCGMCEMCAMGSEQGCLVRSVTYGAGAHGGHADLMLVTARSLAHLPDELTFEEGAAVSCGTGTAWNALKKMGVSGRDTVAIFGQGPVGLSGTLTAKAMGARVIAVDIIPERLAFAQRLGADILVDAGKDDPVKIISELTGARGASASLETTGHPTARSQVLEVLGLFGRCAYVGVGKPATLDIVADVIHKNITIYGSRTFTKSEMIETARFVVETKANLGDLITGRFPLGDAVKAYEEFDRGSEGKSVLMPAL